MVYNRDKIKELVASEHWEGLVEYSWARKVELLQFQRELAGQPMSLAVEGALKELDRIIEMPSALRAEDELRRQAADQAMLAQRQAAEGEDIDDGF